MRRAHGLIILFVTIALIVASGPMPAYAQVVTTTTQTFVNRFGNTVTVTDTFVDGVLASRDWVEVLPDGTTVTIDKRWDFYADGTVKSYTEEKLTGSSPYKIERQYDQSGVLRYQYSELYIGGELSVQSFLTFDSQGFLTTKEQRVLTTLADGTKVWNVTTETWSNDVLVSSQVVQYPYGYDFNAGGGDTGGDTGGGDQAEHRPGWGIGDKNHVHDGPPGRVDEGVSAPSGGSGSSGGSSGSSDGSSDSTERPGRGLGDENHEHTGSGNNN